MKAAIFKGPGDIEVGERPDPAILEPTDASCASCWRASAGLTCGTSAAPGLPADGPIGHEFIGVVEQVGDDVKTLSAGDFVVSPFAYSDGTCPDCRSDDHRLRARRIHSRRQWRRRSR